MRVNVYFAGLSHTQCPWTASAAADSVVHNQLSEQHVRGLSGGCPVYRVTVDVPDEVTLMPAVVVGDDVAAEAVAA